MNDLLSAARDLAPLAAEHAAAGEAQRRLARPVVDGMVAAGLYRALVPEAVGGLEVEPQAFLDAIETLAAGDAAAAWIIAVCGTGGMLGAYLEPAAAAAVYGDPGSIVGGVFAPRGRAVPDGDGYVVTGRWPFASGCQDCTSLMGGCLVADGDDVLRLPSGAPDIRLFLLPAGEFEVHDTWHVGGLRATGSHDISLEGARASAARGASLLADSPTADGALYAFPPFGLLALSVGAVGLGIASAAIADLVELAGGKTPTGSARTLAQRADAQARVARAQASVDAARELVRASVAAAWTAARERGAVDVAERAALRRAATHAIGTAAGAVDAMYDLAGGSAVYDASPLQRRHRDVHVATQHMLVGPATWELAGRVALGVETETSQL
jgi:alkylation response protein AidB-like acyl-CoA dehydrogenase